MVNPSSERITVALDKLKAVAASWHTSASDMDSARKVIITEGLKINRIQAGMFQVAYQPYINTATLFETRMAQATGQLNDIGTTLEACAEVYKQEEERGVHAMKDLY